MSTPEDAKQRAVSTYNTAADAFDDPPLSFWGYFGKKMAERAAVREANLTFIRDEWNN